MNIKYLKDLQEIVAQQTLEYQDLQNVNKFEAENEQVCQEYGNVIDFYKKLKELIVSIHQEMVRSNYECKDGCFKIST